MDYIKPNDVVKNMVAAGKAKASLSVKDLLIRGFLSGALLAISTSRPKPTPATVSAPAAEVEPANA